MADLGNWSLTVACGGILLALTACATTSAGGREQGGSAGVTESRKGSVTRGSVTRGSVENGAAPNGSPLLQPFLAGLAQPSWRQLLKRCAAVRFGEPSWEGRAAACEPLLTKLQVAPAPACIWRTARASCRALGHEAACLPLGYLLRTPHQDHQPAADGALFRDSMAALDKRVWSQSASEACRGSSVECAGVERYLALFGGAGQHADEAQQLIH